MSCNKCGKSKKTNNWERVSNPEQLVNIINNSSDVDHETLEKIDAYLKSWQVFRRVDEIFTLITSSKGPEDPVFRRGIQLLYQDYLVPDFGYTLINPEDPDGGRFVTGQIPVAELAARFTQQYIFRYTFPPVSNLYSYTKTSEGKRQVELDSDVIHFQVIREDGCGYLEFGKHHAWVTEVCPGVFKFKNAQLENFREIKISEASTIAGSPDLDGRLPFPINTSHGICL